MIYTHRGISALRAFQIQTIQAKIALEQYITLLGAE